MIPVYRPRVGELEKRYVNEALDSTWISSKGPFIERFEQGFADYLGVRHAVGTCNGTVALHLALVALGIGPGDEVIVPSLTYVASVNAIAYTGATPMFVDSVESYWNLDPDLLEACITERTKAIMVVHLYGHPVDLGAVQSVADEHGLLVIEDAAEAHGAEYRGRRVGGLGSVGCFSFFGNKIVTTGEGGMVVTDDDAIADRCRHLRGQGVSATRTYWHDVVGYNYRFTNIAAAIGVAQLEGIAGTLAAKLRIAERYAAALSNVDGVALQQEQSWATSVHWMVSVLVHPGLRDDLMSFLGENGVETRPFFFPSHKLPMYETRESFAVAERLSASGINLPSFPDLTDDEVDTVCALLTDFMGHHDAP